MVWLRFLGYFALIAGATALCVSLEARYAGSLRLHEFVEVGYTLATSEYSPLEIAQLVILAASGVILALVAKDYPFQRPLAILLGGVALLCLIRELDFFLDLYVARNAWQIPAGISAALVIVYVYRQQRRLGIAFGRLWPSPALVLMFSSFALLFGVVRLLSNEALWQSILGAGYRPVVVNAVDELVEFAGYLLWLAGVIEYTIEVRALAVREPEPAAVKRRRAQLARRR